MPDPPRHPETGNDTGVRPDRGPAIRSRWWLFSLWLIGIALVVLVVVLHLSGAIGPGGH